MLEYYNKQPKLFKQIVLSHDNRTGAYENTTYLFNFQNRKRLCVIKDHGLKTKNNLIINGCTSFVKCYENFFVVCKRDQVMTISERDVSLSYKVYDYEGNLLGSAPYDWNEKTELPKYANAEQESDL